MKAISAYRHAMILLHLALHPLLPAALALIPALIVAILLWATRTASRLLLTAAIAAALAATAAALPLALIALPTLAALRRAPASALAESRVAGGTNLRIALRIILPLAAPGLLYGAALSLAPGPPAWRIVAAALPLML